MDLDGLGARRRCVWQCEHVGTDLDGLGARQWCGGLLLCPAGTLGGMFPGTDKGRLMWGVDKRESIGVGEGRRNAGRQEG